MFGFRPLPPGVRSRKRATRALFISHGSEGTPEGRSLALLRKWLSPSQREQFGRKSYFEVVGSDSLHIHDLIRRQDEVLLREFQFHLRDEIRLGAQFVFRAELVLEEKGCLQEGLCFMPIGALPIGDVMLAQKIALETCEREVRTVARRFTPNGFHFRQIRPLG